MFYVLKQVFQQQIFYLNPHILESWSGRHSLFFFSPLPQESPPTTYAHVLLFCSLFCGSASREDAGNNTDVPLVYSLHSNCCRNKYYGLGMAGSMDTAIR